MLEISPLPRTKKPSKPPMPSKTSGRKRGNPKHDKLGRFA
jgi:hypothetical protein